MPTKNESVSGPYQSTPFLLSDLITSYAPCLFPLTHSYITHCVHSTFIAAIHGPELASASRATPVRIVTGRVRFTHSGVIAGKSVTATTTRFATRPTEDALVLPDSEEIYARKSVSKDITERDANTLANVEMEPSVTRQLDGANVVTGGREFSVTPHVQRVNSERNVKRSAPARTAPLAITLTDHANVRPGIKARSVKCLAKKATTESDALIVATATE